MRKCYSNAYKVRENLRIESVKGQYMPDKHLQAALTRRASRENGGAYRYILGEKGTMICGSQQESGHSTGCIRITSEAEA